MSRPGTVKEMVEDKPGTPESKCVMPVKVRDVRDDDDVPQHDVLVIILKHSDQCFYSIGWINRPNYLEWVHDNIVLIYSQFQTVFSPPIII